MSQICNFTDLPPTLTTLEPNSTPIVWLESCLTAKHTNNFMMNIQTSASKRQKSKTTEKQKKISSSKQKESSNSNLQNVSISTCYVKKICNLASFRCTVFYLTQITLQLTFPLYKLMQNARLSCPSAADHQKLK